MADPTMSFAPIVATPTPTSWSQAYNAGKLYAVLSLQKTLEDEEPDPKLATLGKEIISALEQEFFTLEEKKLETIKQAVVQTIKTIPSDVQGSLLVVSFVQNILYVYVHGMGQVILKRDGKDAVVLSGSDPKDPDSLKAASGYVKSSDMVILGTDAFFSLVSPSDITDGSVFENAERLTPKIHEKADGLTTAVLIKYQELTTDPLTAPLLAEEEEEETPEQKPSLPQESEKEKGMEEDQPESPFPTASYPFKEQRKRSFSFPKIPLGFSFSLTRKKKLFLLLALALLVILGTSMYFATQKQEASRMHILFEDVYQKAEKKYQDGEALQSLNQNLAHDDFLEAQKILTENQDKFPKGTGEERKIAALLEKTNKILSAGSAATNVPTTKVTKEDSVTLAAILSHKDARYKTDDATSIYIGTATTITTIDKKTDKEKVQIKEGSIQQLGGIGVYLGNIYALDKKAKQILKFTGGSEENKTNYLTTDMDLSSATDMTIDGSIYVLFQDGTIKKFTRGKPDSFAISGLTAPLKNPTHILTTVDFDNIYVLSPSDGKVVVFAKDGSFQKAYQADILKKAQDFDVSEKDNKIFVLSGTDIYSINLN